MAVSVYGFTNETLIDTLYSELGIDNMFSDIVGSYSTQLDQFIRDAEQFIIYRLGRFYAPEDMVGNQWVESKATHIAAHFISCRAGQEYYFQYFFELAKQELDAIATGEIPPSLDIPLRNHTYPAMSNLHVDDRFGVEKLRVVGQISTGQSYPGQFIAYGHFWGWI